jgi:hypothetical protein
MFGRKKKKAFMERPVGEGPTGVWVLYPRSGRFDNLPVIYVGRNDEGVDLFEILLPIDVEEEKPSGMGMRTFPGHTGVRLPLPPGYREPHVEYISEEPD